MIKQYCDRCNIEVKEIEDSISSSIGNRYIKEGFIEFELCKNCNKEFTRMVKQWLKA